MEMISYCDLKKDFIIQTFIDSLANSRLDVDWFGEQLQLFSQVKFLEKGQFRYQQLQFFQCGLLPLPQVVSQMKGQNNVPDLLGCEETPVEAIVR